MDFRQCFVQKLLEVKRKLHIGIEGVCGRWRLGVAATGDGNILAATKQKGGISLHSTSRSSLRPRVVEIFRELVEIAHISPEELAKAEICIGLTGVTFLYDADYVLPEELTSIPSVSQSKIRCVGDIEVIFPAYTQKLNGSAALVHMGSTGFSIVEGKPYRYGGWGPAFGDEGSGYAIGRIVLRAIGEAYDRRSISTDPHVNELFHEVDRWLSEPVTIPEEHLDISLHWIRIRESIIKSCGEDFLPTGLFSFAHDICREKGASAWWSVVSGLVIPLFRVWKNERERETSGVASEIVENAAMEVVKQIQSAEEARSVEFSETPLVLAGGVINHNPDFLECIRKSLNETRDRREVVTKDHRSAARPVLGALMLAMAPEATMSNLSLPEHPIIRRLLEQVQYYPDLKND